MTDWLKSSLRWLSAGWFWPLVLLALPTCGLSTSGVPVHPLLDQGTGDLTFGVFCDIPKANTPRCATDYDIMNGIPLQKAALALNTGQQSYIGLDYSPAALMKSASMNCVNQPLAIDFEGTFPNGYVVCLNCNGGFPSSHADGNAVCAAQCHDLIYYYGSPFPEDQDVLPYCEANAHVSTNFSKDSCAPNACTPGGTWDPGNFNEPRKNPEVVLWTDLIGTEDNGNNISRNTLPSGAGLDAYSAGAASKQTIKRGDAYVEFEAGENDKAHTLGVSMTCETCMDDDPSLTDLLFGIVLYSNGQIYVVENKVLANNGSSFGTYEAGDRFRIEVTDLLDGDANNPSHAHIAFSRVIGTCTPGEECMPDVFYEHVDPGPTYPLRADVSFIQQGASLNNVTIVYIK